MAVDPRQILGAFLTISMFAMLGNMIKRDHFDAYKMSLQMQSGVRLKKFEENKVSAITLLSKGPWNVDSQQLKQCWTKPVSKDTEPSKGFIVFSLTNGPDHHLSQLADAVVIARYVNATLVLPDIRGSEPGQKRKFQDMYDVDKFMRSLDGVITIVKELPPEVTSRSPAVVRVPNGASEDFIVKKIEPIFRANGYLRLSTYFPSVNLKLREKQNADLALTTCLAMFGSLELKPEIQELVDMMAGSLRTLNQKSNGCFVAIDLRTDVLEKKICKQNGFKKRKSCYNAQEIAEFLKKRGFDGNTTIYLTQTWWHESLNFFREIFPNTYIKDDLIPADKKGAFLKAGSSDLQRAIDFYICSQSDAFVPAFTGLFYGHVAGRRIASGRTQILVPSSPSPDFLSSFVSKKNHLAYSCYC
ncbi:hypothetical protein KFK09_011742 [Dendrobium nobile]|uniref:O-fucosyltransferase family protein n=1 Tax=Dendrobium nobile TaxID=94219 RepID=A0A8T3BDE9_DENNO|nr:hypothetical protein KFK09_011742 [Dendrobium nobile]